ncbi:MAG: alpha/beta hydrolase [Deltaproteobacteria bacterium]|nr:alpha/beta hydrolase [Deltaproteobacteria bacterium]
MLTLLWLALVFCALIFAVALQRLFRGPRHRTWTYRGELGARFMHIALRHFGRHGLAALRGRTGRRIPVARWIDRRCTREGVELTVGADAGCGAARTLMGEWIIPRDVAPRCTLLYLHGGGYAFCSIATHRDLMARVALRCRARVLGLAYRLAPEHPFPAALDDARAAYQWLRDSDDAQLPIVFAGDSAGGGLALATLLSLRDAEASLPAAALLFSPWVDLSAAGGSFEENARYDFLNARAPFFGELVRAYAGETGARHPLVSPGLGALHGLAPLLMQVGGAEIFRDQVRAIAERAEKAGVVVQLDELEGMVHVVQALPLFFPKQAREALRVAAAFLDRHLPVTPSSSPRPKCATKAPAWPCRCAPTGSRGSPACGSVAAPRSALAASTRVCCDPSSRSRPGGVALSCWSASRTR